MNNLLFTTQKTQKLTLGNGDILRSTYEPASKTLTILTSQSAIYFLEYQPDTLETKLRNSTPPIQQLKDQNVVLMEYMVDTESVLILTQTGTILTINQKSSQIDIKAQNDDGITGSSVSPTQQFIYIVTKNNTLIQLDSQYDLVREVPLDDHVSEKIDSYDPRFSWKADGSYFALNIMTDKGRKCHTRDSQLNIFRSPSLSDPQPQGLVQSVSEKSRLNMMGLVAWQPSAGIIAGADYVNKGGKKINRVIFWEKNGLRHLQFQLPSLVTDVLNLTWSPDSQILCVQVLLINSTRWLYLYHRSNYHWFLKNTIKLFSQTTQYFLCKKKQNQILIIDREEIQILEFIMTHISSNFHTSAQQLKNSSTLQVNIDGPLLKLTDFSLGIIPPPMCHRQEIFQNNVHGVAIWGNIVLVVTEKQMWKCQWINGKFEKRVKIQNVSQVQGILDWPVNFKIIGVQPELSFSHNSKLYTISNLTHTISQSDKQPPSTRSHIFTNLSLSPSLTLPLPASSSSSSSSLAHFQLQQQPLPLQQDQQNSIANPNKNSNPQLNRIQIFYQPQIQTLTLNKIPYTQHCTSYICYHQFIIYTTVSDTGMYDRMYVIDLQLEMLNDNQKGSNNKESVKEKIMEIQNKKYLNFRTIQRGAIIIGASKNRIIFQMPRGNLQTISPKVITIKHVSKCLSQKLYKQAFQTIRTHKLDLNLLYDINPQVFTSSAQQFLLNISRTDYLNLFVSQLTDKISEELRYCRTQGQIQEIQEYVRLKLQGKKIKEICQIVSKVLRGCDKEKYILTIFTAEIKMGRLNQVLFQIKQMKQNDIEVIIPPHLTPKQNSKQQQSNKKDKNSKNKSLTSQQILQYICWLVDANAIYQASLLTYDLQLASMTARCTQMDPKQYIPYLQQLKEIGDQVELKARICLDLKKYQKAVQELAKGSESQIQKSIQLTKKHKIFKCALKTYAKVPAILREIKLIVIQQLLSNDENSEAYQFCLSIQQIDKALQIAKKLTDSGKIIQCLQANLKLDREARISAAKQIAKDIGEDGFKNKSDLAKLKAYVGNYDQATTYYIRGGNYQKAYKCFIKSTPEYKQTEQFFDGMRLLFSLQKNLLLKQKSLFIQKSTRLSKVHKLRSIQAPTTMIRNLENDDLYSQMSVSSKAASQYTISTTTGMRKKRDKKRNILSRNVKEGSPLEEEYLVAMLADLQNKVDANIKQTKMLIQHLIYANLLTEAQTLRDICREYAQTASKIHPKFYAQVKFQADHPEYLQLLEVYENKGLIVQKDKGKQRKEKYSIDSFNYLF